MRATMMPQRASGLRLRLAALHGALAATIAVATLAMPGNSYAQDRAADFADVTYATVDGRPLVLDIYLPPEIDSPPLVVWIHGGAWRFGSKDNPPGSFVDSGFALASLDFRQSTDAPFPAMVHDIKAAIRFLRANAARFGYSAERVAVSGASSGGHLAALVGTTNGDAALEGTLGDHLDASSEVQAILVYFGASNLTTILAQSTPFGLNIREPSLSQLLGDLPDAVPDVARQASPVFHADADDPPLMWLHGDQDPQMPINQGHELEGVYEKLGLDVRLDVVHGAAHGGDAFYDDEYWPPAAEFLGRVLGSGSTSAVRDVARTSAGTPDFNGIWQALNEANWGLEGHAAAPGPVAVLGAAYARPPSLGVVADGAIPYQPWAAAQRDENFAHRLARDPEVKCYLPGVPRATYMPHPFQIIQGDHEIVIAYQYRGAVRTVYMDAPMPAPAPTWMGWSNGRFEGDTLVVETTDFNGMTWFDRAGNFHSENLRVVERFEHRGEDVLWYEATIEDPTVFTRPWTIAMPLYRRLEPHAELLEFKCVEFAEDLLYGEFAKPEATAGVSRRAGDE